MANPFETKFPSSCNNCDDTVEQGEKMFADKGDFICEFCAEQREVICDCGNYKKYEYDTCYDCHFFD